MGSDRVEDVVRGMSLVIGRDGEGRHGSDSLRVWFRGRIYSDSELSSEDSSS